MKDIDLRTQRLQSLEYVRVVRTWEGDRELERFLKNKKNTKFYCPICSGHCKKLKIKEF
jgi:hypothetical protein